MQIVYADVLFAVNLAMDFLSLYLVMRLARRPMRPGRMLVAAAIGGVWGVLSLFLEESILLQAVLHLAVALLMCLVGCGRPILGITALFYGICCLMGGAMTALWTALNKWQADSPSQGMSSPSSAADRPIPPRILLMLALICGLSSLLLGSLARRRQMAGEASLELTLLGRRISTHGLCDSACFLTEPVSGLPVILIPQSEGKRLLPPRLFRLLKARALSDLTTLQKDLSCRVRLIPGATASGSLLLPAVKPDQCLINGHAVQVYVALASPDSGLQSAILPSDLIREPPSAP